MNIIILIQKQIQSIWENKRKREHETRTIFFLNLNRKEIIQPKEEWNI